MPHWNIPEKFQCLLFKGVEIKQNGLKLGRYDKLKKYKSINYFITDFSSVTRENLLEIATVCSRIRSQRSTSCLGVQFTKMPVSRSRNTEQILLRFSLNDLQKESFQIYATGLSEMAAGCCY